MTSGRMRRVDEAVRQVIGDAVAGDLKDPRVGFVTVTDVKTSADLRHARVYVSVLGEDGRASEPGQREDTLAGLRSAHGFLQGRVASELVLKRIREDSIFVLATHENPDGDALGSLVGMHGLLSALGKSSAMFIAPYDLPLPDEY